MPRIYSPMLVGIEGPECIIPKCRARGRMSGTGWLERRERDWYAEFECPSHGPALAIGSAWSELIEKALESAET